MSIDYGIWHTEKRLSKEEGLSIFLQLIDGEASTVQSHPAIDNFYAEITRLYPEDAATSPWSCPIQNGNGGVVITCTGSRLDEIEPVIKRLATKHGLVMIDSESEQIRHPDE